MKGFKVCTLVDDLIDQLPYQYKNQVKCAYISKVEYDDDSVDIYVVIDEDDGTDEFYDITENWVDEEDVLVDEYMNYLMDNHLFEDEEKDNG